MSLFNSGDFILHSGKSSNFLIDCDALTDEDLVALAKVKSNEMVPFGRVVGIVNGGVRFANALRQYAIPNKGYPTLIVDDVLTTGKSMDEMKKKLGVECIGLVIFARAKPDWWIRAIFQTG